MKRVLKSHVNLVLLSSLLAFILFLGTLNMEDIKVRVYPLLRGIQHELIIFNTKTFNIRETKNFIIRYETEDKEVIDLVAKAAENKYQEVNEVFNYSPKEKSIIIVYNDPQKLMENSNLNQGKPPMGVYYASTIQIINPRYWISEDQDMEDIFINEGPMVHEYTHLVVDDIAKGNYPLWFTEGLALYQEYLQTGYEWGKDLRYPEKPYSVDKLTKNFGDLDEILAYKRSFQLVKGLAEREGLESLSQLLRELNKGRTFEEAHKRVFGKSINEIYE